MNLSWFDNWRFDRHLQPAFHEALGFRGRQSL